MADMMFVISNAEEMCGGEPEQAGRLISDSREYEVVGVDAP